MDNEFNEIIDKIINRLKNIHYNGDLSDIGNEIGIIIGNYVDNDKLGYDLDGFFSGVKHGISLVDGTHDGTH